MSTRVADNTSHIRRLRQKEAEYVAAEFAARDARQKAVLRMEMLRRYLKQHNGKIMNGRDPEAYRKAGLPVCSLIIETEGESLWQ